MNSKSNEFEKATGVQLNEIPEHQLSREQFPTEIIELPSRGKLYPSSSPLKSGKVEMKYMTTKEEDILTSMNLIRQGVALDMFVKSLLVTDVNFDELLLGDYDALIISSRILGYGPQYNFNVKCPMCGFSPKQGHTIDLRTIKDKNIDFDIFEPNSAIFSITLPISKKEVRVKLFTRKDETSFKNELKGLEKLNLPVLPENSTMLKHMIVSVDGDSSTQVIREFVDKMLGPDSLYLKQQIANTRVGLDTSFVYTCPSCNHETEMVIPIDASFFWPGA